MQFVIDNPYHPKGRAVFENTFGYTPATKDSPAYWANYEGDKNRLTNAGYSEKELYDLFNQYDVMLGTLASMGRK